MCEYEFQGHKFNSEEEYKEFILRGGDKLYEKYTQQYNNSESRKGDSVVLEDTTKVQD